MLYRPCVGTSGYLPSDRSRSLGILGLTSPRKVRNIQSAGVYLQVTEPGYISIYLREFRDKLPINRYVYRKIRWIPHYAARIQCRNPSNLLARLRATESKGTFSTNSKAGWLILSQDANEAFVSFARTDDAYLLQYLRNVWTVRQTNPFTPFAIEPGHISCDTGFVLCSTDRKSVV